MDGPLSETPRPQPPAPSQEWFKEQRRLAIEADKAGVRWEPIPHTHPTLDGPDGLRVQCFGRTWMATRSPRTLDDGPWQPTRAVANGHDLW